jgi:hypothetical protein
MSWVTRCVVLAVLILGTATRVRANYSSSFKEVAATGGAIVLARCSTSQAGSIVCKPLEIWRGKPLRAPIVIASDEWAADSVSGLEKDPEARFLVIVGDDGQVGCLLNLPILGDRSVCVVPILKGGVPATFRHAYDHTDGPRLALDDVKKDLLSKSGPKAGT